MIVKRYIGKTTQEAMKKLRVELGPEAIILHTRKIKKSGFLGLFGKSLIEIVAAIDEEETGEEDTKPKVSSRSYNIEKYKNHSYNSTPRKNFGSTIKENEEKNSFSDSIKDKNKVLDKNVTNDFFDKLNTQMNVNNNQNSKSNEEINKEIQKLRGTMEGFMKSFESKMYKDFYLPEKLRPYKDILVDNGVSEIVSNSILGNIDKNVNLEDKNESEVKEVVKFNINGYLGNPSPIRYNNDQKIVFFIGPTGVGKTTTLAKLAAYYTLEKKLNVGLVTADTYRIAAVEQLKIYSDILDLPIKIIYEKKDFYEVLSNFNDKDVVFVDTAGRSHKNSEQMEDVKELLEIVKQKDIFLVLSATTNIENIKDILKQYSFIDNFKIIFTKSDESNNLGVILDTKFYTDKPLSYITTGQNVPEDIEIIDIPKLSNELIGETKHERSS
ncbi:flagellar biosynthesis protein FlhF [Sporosalibacterium faouarense]|uniref:flagellar biosynthesis protein FlhF n=1 Tax=Sporosalibacterium faouarense TaxID=516123 RepID=UPI00141D301A|nr:flagellar biosynthesis protein FlhF [Sporosalibacterium faouarense]MTI48009.1 flagellar biosynthesis protein FlhF [Bacillota bacterium]